MGIFHELVEVINRAPVDLRVTFDGQTTVLKPGRNSLPKITVDYAKRQNVIMGTADPDNPSMSGAMYLIGVADRDDCTPLSPEDWARHTGAPCRLDLEILSEDRLATNEHFEVKNKGRKAQATNRSQAHSATPVFEADASA